MKQLVGISCHWHSGKAAGAPAKLAGDIGSAGNMIAGSLADAANQEGDFAQNAAINGGINIGAQGYFLGWNDLNL